MTARVLRALVAVEARRSLRTVVSALACMAGLPIVPLVVLGDRERLAAWLPSLAFGLVAPAVAAALGGDAVAGERASRTWDFLRARPVSRAQLMAVKVSVSAVSAVGFGLGAWSITSAWIGRAPAAGDVLGASVAVGLGLCAALSLAALTLAIVAGARVAEPLVATLAGFLLAELLVELVLYRSPLAHAAWSWATGPNGAGP